MTSMRRTSRRWFPWLPAGFLLLLAACAGGGGSTGTGITTAEGNVASVSSASSLGPKRDRWLARVVDFFSPARVARAAGGVENVTVTIAGTNLATKSDANGFFSLRGSFGGPITIVFQSPGFGPARLDVKLPTGGTLTLNDVQIDDRTGQAVPTSRNLLFDGVVSSADCTTEELQMVSEATPTDGNVYPVNVQGATLRDSSGNTIVCGDLTSGDVLSVQGLIANDGAVDCQQADRRRHSGPDSGPGGM